MRSCSFVKLQALIVMLEHLKHRELTCWTQLNFDIFDHFLKVKVAEIFLGAPDPPVPPFRGLRPPPAGLG